MIQWDHMKVRILKNKGFTLIELLVSLTIIGVLAFGASTLYQGSQRKARDAGRENDIVTIRKAVEMSYGDFSLYPKPSEINTSLVSNGYIPVLPIDPKAGSEGKNTMYNYVYAASFGQSTRVTGSEFEVSAAFEHNGNDDTEMDDSGNDIARWEIGINTPHVNTNLKVDGSSCDYNNYAFGEGGGGNCVIIGP